MKFSTEKIRGIDYEIEIDQYGKFTCKVDGDTLEAPSLEALKRKLMEHSRTKQKNISIPFVIWKQNYEDEPGKLVHGLCVGIHAGNDNLLVRMGGKEAKVEQFQRWHGEQVLDPAKAEELAALHKAANLARKKLKEFTEKNSLNLRALVTEQMAKGENDEEKNAK